ncbi:MAG: HIT domain-containing protein [Nanoarchaeota archaeon]|nr:HIT domain-containing protein [Nanoarchaeota archaeon]
MALAPDQINQLKSQLKDQIKNLSPEKKKEAESQIDSLSTEALESMLEEQSQRENQKTIFRMLVDGEVPSVKIGENSHAIAVLSTKSLSKGHAIIIPKSQIIDENKIPKEVHSLSEEISKKLISSLSAKSTEILSEKLFGEVILNVIPIYDKPVTLKSKREDVPVEELEKIKTSVEVLKIEKKAPEIIKVEAKTPEILKLKRRIP